MELKMTGRGAKDKAFYLQLKAEVSHFNGGKQEVESTKAKVKAKLRHNSNGRFFYLLKLIY